MPSLHGVVRRDWPAAGYSIRSISPHAFIGLPGLRVLSTPTGRQHRPKPAEAFFLIRDLRYSFVLLNLPLSVCIYQLLIGAYVR